MMQRPRPSMAPRLLTAGAARSSSSHAMNTDSLSDESDAENSAYPQPTGSEDASPRSGHRKRSQSSVSGPDGHEPESRATWPSFDDAETIDFDFGTQAGASQPLGRDSPEGHIAGAAKRPKAAGMMVVRSGLRCPRWFLKAWVCLCHRAPIEIDRRRKKPSSCAHHIPLCLLRTISAMPTRQWTQHCLRTAHPGSESFQHHRWRVTPASTAVGSVPSSFLHRTSSNFSRAHSSTCKQLTRSVSVKVYPSPRQAPPNPNRGPKSAPEPRHDCSASITSYRLWGVRVSPLSAGGEGLCKAQSWLLNRPGKQAEGSQTQIGPFSCHRSTCSRHYQLSVLPQMEPWGSRLRIWKFKYKVVRFRIKRCIKLAVGFTSGSRPPKSYFSPRLGPDRRHQG